MDDEHEMLISFRIGTYEPDGQFIAEDIVRRLGGGAGWCNWIGDVSITDVTD